MLQRIMLRIKFGCVQLYLCAQKSLLSKTKGLKPIQQLRETMFTTTIPGQTSPKLVKLYVTC